MCVFYHHIYYKKLLKALNYNKSENTLINI